MSRQRGYGEYSPIVDFNKAMDAGYKFNKLNDVEKRFIRENGGTFLKNIWYMIKKHNPITNSIRFYGTLFSGMVGSSGIELIEDQDAAIKNFYIMMYGTICAAISGAGIVSLMSWLDGVLQLLVNGNRNVSLNEQMNKQAVQEMDAAYKRFDDQMVDIIRQAEVKKDTDMESRFRDGLKRLRRYHDVLKDNKYLSK